MSRKNDSCTEFEAQPRVGFCIECKREVILSSGYDSMCGTCARRLNEDMKKAISSGGVFFPDEKDLRMDRDTRCPDCGDEDKELCDLCLKCPNCCTCEDDPEEG